MAAVTEVVAKFRVEGAEEAKRTIMSFGRSMDGIPKALAAMVGAAAGIGTLIGAQAIAASNEVEALQAALEALTGSADVARSKWKFIQDLALPSKSTALELGAVGLQIEGIGLQMERVLPLVVKWTAGMGNVNPERMQMATRVFGSLAAGRKPELEALSGLGVSEQQLTEFGMRFGKNGEMVSSAREGLAALEALIQSKYGNILDKLASTGSAKLSSFADMWQRALVTIGDVLKGYVMPVVDQLTLALTVLSQNDVFGRMARDVMGLFGTVSRNQWADFVVSMLQGWDWVIDAIKRVGPVVTSLFRFLWDNARVLAAVIGGIWATGPIMAFLKILLEVRKAMIATTALSAAMATLAGGLGAVATAALVGGAIYAALGTLPGMADPDLNALGKPVGTRRNYEPLRKMLSADNSAPPTVPQFEGTGWGRAVDDVMGAGSQQARTLSGIERNTRDTADNTSTRQDFKRYALGGGELARIGVTPIEMRRHQRVQINVSGGGNIRDALEELITQVVHQMRAQGRA